MKDRFKRLNTPQKVLDRIFNYPVKQRFMNIFPKPSVNYAKKFFKNKAIDAIEIGVYKGVNAESILKHLNIRSLTLIDPYQEYGGYDHGYYDQTKKTEKEAKKRLRKYRRKIRFIKKMSDDAVKDAPLCDFIYIDGNHDYQYVKKDIANYSKKLKIGCILAGHDVQMPGVIKAIVEFASKNPNYELCIENPDWWMIKRK